MTHSTDSNHGTTTRDRTRRQRTVSVSVSLSDRGQTTQDFAVGIGIFILAVAFVFSFLPSIVTPYDSSVGGAETAQADRIADRALANLSTDNGPPNQINATHDAFTGTNWDDNDTVETFGLRNTTSGGVVFIDRMNVSIETLNDTHEGPVTNSSSGAHLAFGSEYGDQAAASSARIVTIDSDDIDPSVTAYRLVVRVW